MQPKQMWIQHDVPGKLWEMIGADIYKLNIKTYLFIVNYYSKLPVVKQTEGLSVAYLVNTCKIIFSK